MKNIVYITLLMSAVLFNSCQDILDRAPLDQISDAVVWDDPALVEAYLYQAYASAPFHASQKQDQASSLDVVLPVTVADEGFSKKSHEKGAKTWKKNLLTETGGLFEYWGYNDVRRCNEFIELIETSSLPGKEVYKAEMRFIRAYTYFEMVKRYGGVPLITEVQDVKGDSIDLFVSRNSEKEVYDFIAAELDEAILVLPEKHEGAFGRATKFAAAALKSRAMMYAASTAQFGTVQLDGLLGIPTAEANDYWQECYDACKIIMDDPGANHGLYNLNPDKVENFQNIFLDEQNIEVIFAKQYAGLEILGHNWDTFNGPQGFGNPTIINSGDKQGASVSVYLEMVEEFENIDGTPGTLFSGRDKNAILANDYTIDELFGNKDPRFHASVFYHGTEWRGATLSMKKYNVVNGVKNNVPNLPTTKLQEKTGFHIRKGVSNTSTFPGEFASSDVDYIVFRYGEILLNFAEAAFELGKTGEALYAINQLRERAGIALLGSIDRDKIRHERKVELAFEGNRFWDLRRWRTAVDEINRTFYGIEYGQIDDTDRYKIYLVGGTGDGQYVCSVSEKYYYFPITPNRIANNPNLAPENPGY